MTQLDLARHYVELGLSLIPIRPDGSKAPVISTWKEFMGRLPNDTELQQWFHDERFGVAVVCGKVSGNLEVIDFDCAEVWEEWSALVESERPGFLDCIPRVRTPSGGVHLYIRLDGPPGGNRKLARDQNGETLIEVRGERGYVLAPGCPPTCHPTGKTYTWEIELEGASCRG